MIILLAMACITVPAVGIGGFDTGKSSVDSMGGGISESEPISCRFPIANSTNFDSMIVGNDKAVASGNYWDSGIFGNQAKAENNLEISKNQLSDNRTCCFNGTSANGTCSPCSPLINLEQIRVGNRKAFAYGSAVSANNIKITTNQE